MGRCNCVAEPGTTLVRHPMPTMSRDHLRVKDLTAESRRSSRYAGTDESIRRRIHPHQTAPRPADA